MKHLFLTACAAVALALGVAPAVVAQDHSHHQPALASGSVGVPVTVGQPSVYAQPSVVGQSVVLGRATVGKGCGCATRQPAYSTVVRYPQATTYGTATTGVVIHTPATAGVVSYPVASAISYPVVSSVPQTVNVGQPLVSSMPTVASGSSATPHCSKCATGK